MRYQAYLFDVQGTLLDFFTPVSSAIGRYLSAVGVDPARAAELTRRWRENYFQRISVLVQSADEWTRVSDEYAAGFRDVCAAASLPTPSDSQTEQIAAGWADLVPWPDTVSGLARIREQALTAALSNTDMQTVVRMSKRLGIDWDMVLTAEVFGAFKPNPVLYRRAVRYLGLKPSEVAMVASHPYDLRAAAQQGLGTVFVYRPMEYGDPDVAHQDTDGEFGQRVSSLHDIE